MESNEVIKVNDLDLKDTSFICIASKRMSGKSVLTKNLIMYLLNKFEYKFVVLFSDTAKFNGDYDFLKHKDMIYESDQMDSKIPKILNLQKQRNKKLKNKVHGLIILDDVKLYTTSKPLVDLASKGRHYKLTVIVSVQFPKTLISPAIRSNIDYLFWSDLNETGLKAVYESITIKQSFKNFVQFVEEHNHSYQFMFFNGKENDKTKRFKIVKASEYQNLKMY